MRRLGTRTYEVDENVVAACRDKIEEEDPQHEELDIQAVAGEEGKKSNHLHTGPGSVTYETKHQRFRTCTISNMSCSISTHDPTSSALEATE